MPNTNATIVTPTPVIPGILDESKLVEKLEGEIDLLQQGIDERTKQLMDFIIGEKKQEVKEMIPCCSHYYTAETKTYEFNAVDQLALRGAILRLLNNERFEVYDLDELLTILEVNHQFFGKQKILYISLEILCWCQQNNQQIPTLNESI